MGKDILEPHQKIIIGGGSPDGTEAMQITKNSSCNYDCLKSDHEEADTRILLHADNASLTHERIVIHSSDIDVIVLSVSMIKDMRCEVLWFHTGLKDKLRYIPCHKIAQLLGLSTCKALPGLHAITGCDTTSALSGIGKKKAFKLLNNDDDAKQALSQLGSQLEISSVLLKSLEYFICQLYVGSSGSGNSK